MKYNLIIGGIVAALLILVITSIFMFKGDTQDLSTNISTSTAPAVEEGMVRYTDPGERFYFDYPADLTVTGPTTAATRSWRAGAPTTGYTLARLSIPQSYMQSANFAGAELRIGQSTDPREINATGCPAGSTAAPGSASAESINGQVFTKLTTPTAGGRTTSYFTIRDGDCYVIEYTIRSSGTETVSDEIRVLLEAIAKSFVFTIESE